MRIFMSGIWHETNTFSSVLTDIESFRRYQYTVGDECEEVYSGTNTEIGGMLAAAHSLKLQMIPGMFCGAVPSGLVTADTLTTILNETIRKIPTDDKIDGLVVALHGAFVSALSEGSDAFYLKEIRKGLPPNIPIVGTLDLHANVSLDLVNQTDLLVSYKTYPHRDMGSCGEFAIKKLAFMLETGERPACAFRKLPFAPPPLVQVTDEEPVSSIMRRVAAAEARKDVWSVSVTWGFPYADIADLGVGVIAYADEQHTADFIADDIATEIWNRRYDFDAGLICVESALDEAHTMGAGPSIMVEVADNTGGGAPGDATPVLKSLLERSFAGSVIVIWDPLAVKIACSVGMGGNFIGMVGGKADDLHGSPAYVSGEIIYTGNVNYKRTGNYMTGQKVSLGNVAVIKSKGVCIALTTEKAMPFDNDHLRVLGIKPEQQRLIVVKSAIAWRPHFRPFSCKEYYLDTKGITASNLSVFSYKNQKRAIYPIDKDVIRG